MKKLLTIILLSFETLLGNAQTTAWLKQVNEEESFLAAGSSKYFTVSKTAYGNRIYTVRSFDTSGNALLATTISPGSPYTAMTIKKILATPSNDLFILAYATYGTTGDALLIKLNTNLLQPWLTALTAGTGLQNANPVDLIVKGSDIAVLMNSIRPSGGNVPEVRTINQSSGVIGIPRFTSASTTNFKSLALTVDGSSNVYFCGQIGMSNAVRSALLVKLNSSLTQQWSISYVMSIFSTSEAWFGSLAVDYLNNVYVAGAGSASFGNPYKTIVRKYNTSGTFQSGYVSAALPNGNYYSDTGFKLKLTVAGNVFVGTATNTLVTPKFFVYKFSSTNLTTPIYATSYSVVTASSNFVQTGFEATQSGKAFITGTILGSASSKSYVTAKFRTDGTLEFSENSSSGACNAMIKAIPGAYPNDEFVTTGVIGNINRLKKYTGPGARIETNETQSTEADELLCYPNPAYAKFAVKGISNATEVMLFDMAGKKVLQQKVNANENVDIVHLPRGTYFIKAVSGDSTIHLQKLVLQ